MLSSLRMAALGIILAAAPALAGPPWISIEYPSNPFDAATRDAVVVVHTYHHGIPMQYPVRAYAEGLVNGVRQRVALQVIATSRTGVWAVKGNVPRTGSWVIRADMTDGETSAGASALVAISNGELVSVRVPSHVRDGWTIPSVATEADMNDMLALAEAASATTHLSARR